MEEHSLEIIADVLRDCAVDAFSITDSDARVLFDEISIMEQMHESVDLSVEEGTRLLADRDFLNSSALDNAVDGNANPFLWPPVGEENCPEEVLLEIEVYSSMEEEEERGKTFTDLDRVSQSSSECSDYGSESGTDHTSDMDLSQGSLDLSKTGPYYPGPHTSVTATTTTTPSIHTPTSITSRQHSGLDLSRSANRTPNGSVYMHHSGGTVTTIGGQIYTNDQNGYYIPRIKLEPGLHIDPTITYKPEMDFNHNQPLTSSVLPNPSAPYFNELHYEQNIQSIVVKSEQLENGCETRSPELYERVTVETVNPNCIPLTVTSPDDDDNDSGTESIDSKDSDACNNLTVNENGTNVKGDRKRPGRKKGQVSKVYHLWEFIRDVLNDPRHSGKVIKWENEEEGIFRVVQSEIAASMWGQKKNNRTKMTYEKMSRSIRYSRKEGYFDDLPKDKGYPKKLCFKFGKKAHGWNKKKPILCNTNMHVVNEQRL